MHWQTSDWPRTLELLRACTYRFTSSVWHPLTSYHFFCSMMVMMEIVYINIHDSLNGSSSLRGKSWDDPWQVLVSAHPWHSRRRGRCNVHATRAGPIPWVNGKSTRWCCSCDLLGDGVGYPLVNSHIAIGHWTWPFIVSFPNENGDFP